MTDWSKLYGEPLTTLESEKIDVSALDALFKAQRDVTRPEGHVYVAQDKRGYYYFADDQGVFTLPRKSDIVFFIKKIADAEALKKANDERLKQEAEKAAKEAAQSYGKRDFLRSIEKNIQKRWEEMKIYELDAPEDKNVPKFMATFPYPYMNGRLHIGHSFTVSKAEFATAYYQLKGRRVLFPFGLHCTGMPIKACADKIKREIEEFGNPPQFPPEPVTADVKVYLFEENRPKKRGEAKSKKSKAAAKSGGATRQWNIMLSSGVSEDEIPKFADANYWLEYFPPLAIADLKALGVHVDWRRSFITTDVNPYYDAFVRWQFEHLRAAGRIKFGKRYTIYSPSDGGPCLDHDRQVGETVLPQEYTLIKQELLRPFPQALKSLEDCGKKVYLVPATLRPETMYGQTNCWVSPNGEYGAFEVNNTEIFICTERAARNLAFQGFSPEFGQVKCLLKFKGRDIIGVAVKAPLTNLEKIYVLPMWSINTEKTTGVVTSVPSDSPDDYAALRDVKTKEATQKEFGITPEMLPELIEIIDVPGYGTRIAEKLVNELKIKSQNDRELLDKAKEIAYQKGYYEGVMIVGPYAGTKVEKAKNAIRASLIEQGLAVVYSEPASRVISRSGDECVVCLCDQWYIDYGEEEWRKLGEKCLAQLDTYSEEVRTQFRQAFDWMKQWACSRTYGLGTRLPWDPVYLIDSLSDSTIYMAYYTIAHYLQGDISGSKPGIGNIKPSSLTPAVFDYIFLGKEIPKDTDIPHETLRKMREEFLYWYPLDLRVSGKDLVPNHLLFFIYNHVSIFPENLWPKGIRANGHILYNGQKMSKSTGVFLTLSEAIEKYGADGVRFALADAGDSLDDANFTDDTANSAILRLWAQIQWIEEMLKLANDPDAFRDEEATTLEDIIFLNEMRLHLGLADKAYDRLNFKEALKHGFFELQSCRDAYVKATKMLNQKLNKRLIMQFIRAQAIALSPICPHVCEYIWMDLLKEPTSINRASWPDLGPLDAVVLKQRAYISAFLHATRVKLNKLTQKAGNKPKQMIITVAKQFPAWKKRTIELLSPIYKEKNAPASRDEVLKIAKSDELLSKNMKKVMSYASDQLPVEFKEKGLDAFELEMPFDEQKLLESHSNSFKDEFGVEEVIIQQQPEGQEVAVPGRPSVQFK